MGVRRRLRCREKGICRDPLGEMLLNRHSRGTWRIVDDTNSGDSRAYFSECLTQLCSRRSVRDEFAVLRFVEAGALNVEVLEASSGMRAPKRKACWKCPCRAAVTEAWAKAGCVAWLISSSGEIAIRQERAKRFDFRRHEIGESPYSGRVLHIPVHE